MSSDDRQRGENRVTRETTFFVEVYSADSQGIDPAKVIVCNSLDISAGGIQLQMDRALAVGSILRLCADIDRSEDVLYLVGEVKWVTAEDDFFNLGFELYDAVDSDINGWKNQLAKIL
ncbi:MAG: hypothetical protein ACI9WS_001808 [Paraglaciecola psychrophila]|jgi:hypothetical protein